MKTRSFQILLFWAAGCLYAAAASAQQPAIHWVRKFGGSATDVPLTIKNTTDGNLIAAGYTESKNGDVSNHAGREFWDLWVTKISRCGDLLWQRSFGGTGYETARDVLPTNDGGFLVIGETNSTDGDVAAGYGGTKDIWLLKLSATGDLLWQRRYGGSGLDIGYRIIAAPDGNFLILAATSSNDGDIQGNHSGAGYTDAALLKINAQGDVLWSKCFGGSLNDELLDLLIIDNRIFAAGYANSTDGDIPASQKNYDVWLLSTDLNGNKSFSKIYGGSQNDVAYSICQGRDGSLGLAGYTTSNDGQVSGAKGSQDFWIVNISRSGVLNWQTVAGGSESEFANAIVAMNDGGYIAGGISYSTDGDIQNANKEGDYWMAKLDAKGKLEWTQALGGKQADHLRAMAFHSDLNELYLAGDAASIDGHFSGEPAAADFGIIKLKFPNVDTVDCQNPANPSPPDSLRDRCGYDSVVIVCRPPARDDLYEFEQIRVPNAFTPNGDGKNDVWGAAGKYIDDFFVQVFNRYGELVFQSNAIRSRWDGNYRGRPQPAGTYVYSIRYRDSNKQQQAKKGVFILIR